MVRSARQNLPSSPVKVSKRRLSESSSFDLSDDNGYSAVEDISDFEDDDEDDVKAAEEDNILTEGSALSSTPARPQTCGDEAPNDDDEDDDNDDDDVDENASWAGISSEMDDSQMSELYQGHNSFAEDAVVERHVHFDVLSSDSDSTDTEDDHADLFPDIFVSQSALDPAFRREIEHDADESSGSGSFWDFNGQHDARQDSDAEEIVRQLSDDGTATSRPLQSPPVQAVFTPVFEETHELDGYESEFLFGAQLVSDAVPVLIYLAVQPMVIRPKRMFRSLPSGERRDARLSR